MIVLITLCLFVVRNQAVIARHEFYYTNNGGTTCASGINNEVYRPNIGTCSTNGTCKERTFLPSSSAEEIVACPSGAASNSYNPAVSFNYAIVKSYQNVDCSGLPTVYAVAPEDKCSGGSSIGTYQIRCDPVGFPSTLTLCGNDATNCEDPSCNAVVPHAVDGATCTPTIGNGHGPVFGGFSFTVQCPARYQMLTSWSDTTACETSKLANAVSFTRVSHFPGTVSGCLANSNEICVSHDIQPVNNYPADPNVDYAQSRSCRSELSDYTRPVDQGMIKFWCTPKNCQPSNKPDHVKVFQPGVCSGVTTDLFFSQAVNQPNGARAWIITCGPNPKWEWYDNSQCLNAPIMTTSALVSDRTCQETSVAMGGSFWGGNNNYAESPCGDVVNTNPLLQGAQSYTLICPDTASPTVSPTKSPTKSPTQSPTKSPTKSPSKTPTVNPSRLPTKSPTPNPTPAPTPNPTAAPTTQFGSDLSFSHGTGHCGTAGSCRCRLAVIDCHCEKSKFCFCENVAGRCYGGNAEIVTVGPEVNVDCEDAERCIIETYAPTTAPPSTAANGSSGLSIPILLVSIMAVLIVFI